MHSDPQQSQASLKQAMLANPCSNGLSKHFPSHRPALWAMRLAITTLVLTLGICYCLWRQRGCLAFLPYISDLGLQGSMKVVFMSGLLLTALLMAYTLPHIVAARRLLLLQLGSSKRWRRRSDLLALAGAGVVIGIAALGFLPWDRRLMGHLIATSMIFGGGIVWTAGSVLLGFHLRDAPQCGGFRWSRRLQAAMLLAIILDLVVSTVCFACAFYENTEMFDPKVALHLAQTDFQGYCTAEKGWHGLTGVNLAALTEWLLVAFLLTAVLASFADVEAYSKFIKSANSSALRLVSGLPAGEAQQLASGSPAGEESQTACEESHT